MHICNYCGRFLKQEYETCPGCGGSSFKTKAFLGEEIIKNPPKGGYQLDMSNLNQSKRTANIFLWIGRGMAFLPILFCLPLIFIGFGDILFLIPCGLLLGSITMVIAGRSKKETKQAIKRIKKLSTEGILIKGMPYKLVDTGTMVMGKYYKCIEVKYKNSAGVEIPLYSETKYNTEKNKNDDSVDLLIDPNDYSNYFIDYEIY